MVITPVTMTVIMILCIPITFLMRAEKGIGSVSEGNTGKGMKNSENLPGRVSVRTLMGVAAVDETVTEAEMVEENEAVVKVAKVAAVVDID